VDQQVTSDPASFDALSSYLILVDWDGLFCSGYLSYFVLVTRSGGLTGFLGLSIGELGEMTGETTTARAKAKADPYGMTNKKGSFSANTPSFAVKPAKDGAPVLLADWSFGTPTYAFIFRWRPVLLLRV
jgi:hypothetical protein